MADLHARIADLWRYPVKACAGERVHHLDLDAAGWPVGDRGWAIATADGELTWSGAHPNLARIQARLTATGVSLSTADRTVHATAGAGRALALRAWNGDRQDFDALHGWDAGDEAAALLHAATGAALRLVQLDAAAQRRAGLNPLHLVGHGSLQAWHDALGNNWPEPAADLALRARPNLLLEADAGADLPPFVEDLALHLDVGPLRLTRTQACVRCIVPTVSPTTGLTQPQALETLTRLSAERAPGASVQFGIYVAAKGAGRLHVGDRVALTLDFPPG